MWSVAWIFALTVTLLTTLPACSEAEPPKGPQVLLSTSMGDMKIGLYEKEAPETVKNFLAYVNEGYYDGTIFHRVIAGFMVQGGGFTPDMKQKETKAAIKNEADNGLSNDKGTLAMARTNAINSATSQFFVNAKDNDFLNHQGKSNFGYCVFGKVIEGIDILEKIEGVQTGRQGGQGDVPLESVVITSAKVIPAAEKAAEKQ